MLSVIKRGRSIIILLAVCAALIGVISYWLGPDPLPKEAELTSADQLPAPLTADKLAAYNVEKTNASNPTTSIKTNYGTIELELFTDTMPITTANFIKLAKEGFYNGTKFHRVIDGFMIQGGDPISKTEEALRYGNGGPGYTITDEFVAGKFLTNVRGTIAMANTGQPNSGGSQFFINLVDNTGLDYDKPPTQSSHPVFGRVLNGMEVVDEIGKVKVNSEVPVKPVLVESVSVSE
jgi:peptidylprolyl isomerase